MESLVLTRNLEAESIRSRAESTGGCVNLKTVTKIRQRSARDTFIADSVYLVLNFLLDWEPVERFKQRSDVVSFTFLLLLLLLLWVQHEASNTVLNATKAVDRSRIPERPELFGSQETQQLLLLNARQPGKQSLI